MPQLHIRALEVPRAGPDGIAAPIEPDSELYRRKLHDGLARCGRARFGEIGGEWVGIDAGRPDVWLCEGLILWKNDWGGTSELCITTFDPPQGDADAIHHEDINDPGDASGLYLHFRYDGRRLLIEGADWDMPAERHPFFTLERKEGGVIDPDAPCPRALRRG